MTNKQLKTLYRQYNKRYFNNILDKTMIVRFSSEQNHLQKSLLGGAFWRHNPRTRRAQYYKILVQRTGGTVIAKQTLLHEMIHVYIGHKYNHGPRFVKEIKRLARAGAYDRLL